MTEGLQKVICGGSGSACRKRVVTRTALRDGLLEQSVGAGASHQCGDTETPGRFTRNSDAIWITTKAAMLFCTHCSAAI